MADATTDPTHVEASSEPHLAGTETELATNPVHGVSAEEEKAPAVVCAYSEGSAISQISDDSIPFIIFKR